MISTFNIKINIGDMQKFNIRVHGMHGSSNSKVIHVLIQALSHTQTHTVHATMHAHSLTYIHIHIQSHKHRHTLIHRCSIKEALAQSRKSPECLPPKGNTAII